jgi:hypothetical protein
VQLEHLRGEETALGVALAAIEINDDMEGLPRLSWHTSQHSIWGLDAAWPSACFPGPALNETATPAIPMDQRTVSHVPDPALPVRQQGSG